MRQHWHATLTILAAFVALSALSHSEEAPEITVTFLGKEAGADAFVDESVEPYFALLQPYEMVAKTRTALTATELSAQRDECRQRYRDSVRDFTDEEKSAIGDSARAIHVALKERYPLLAEIPWSFIKISATAEGGLPHTRGAHIVIPDMIARLFTLLRSQGNDPVKSNLGEMLIHEQCHVLQRAHPALFEELYTQVWGFLRAKDLPSCAWLDQVQVMNPDGVDTGWLFPDKGDKGTTYWQPLVVLCEGIDRPRMPRDFLTIGVARDQKGESFPLRMGENGKPITQPLDKIPAFAAAFGHVPENFHPNETFAVLFSWLAMQSHISRTGMGLEDHSTVDFKPLRAWCRKHLGGEER